MAQSNVLQTLNAIFENRAAERRDDRDAAFDALKLMQQDKQFQQELAIKKESQRMAQIEFNERKKTNFIATIDKVQAPIVAQKAKSANTLFNSLVLPMMKASDAYDESGAGDDKKIEYDFKKYNTYMKKNYNTNMKQNEILFRLASSYHTQGMSNSDLMVQYVNAYSTIFPGDEQGIELTSNFIELDQQIKMLDKERKDIQLGDYEFNEYVDFLNETEIAELEAERLKQEAKLKAEAGIETGEVTVTRAGISTAPDTSSKLVPDVSNILYTKVGGDENNPDAAFSFNTDNVSIPSDIFSVDNSDDVRTKENKYESQLSFVSDLINQQEDIQNQILDTQQAYLDSDYGNPSYTYEGSTEQVNIDKSLAFLAADIARLNNIKDPIVALEAESEALRRGRGFSNFKDFLKNTVNYVTPGAQDYAEGRRLRTIDGFSFDEDGGAFPTIEWNEEAGGFRYDVDSIYRKDEPEGRRTLAGDLLFPIGKGYSELKELIDDIKSYEPVNRKK